MRAQSRTGLVIAGVGIAFCAICFALYFAFTPVFIAAALAGVIGAVSALAAKARRTALVAALFGLVPFGQFLIESFTSSEVLVFAPGAMAMLIAAFAFANYSSGRRSESWCAT